MQTDPAPDSDERLLALLRSSRVDLPLPPRFKDEVWRRIERTELRPEFHLWAALRRLVEVALPRPKVAFAYVSVLLALGMTAGIWAAQLKNTRTEASLGSRYVQSIDPYKAVASAP